MNAMRLLILGGGVFLGAAVLNSALRRGHTVTAFNRGRSRSVWPAGVEGRGANHRAAKVESAASATASRHRGSQCDAREAL